MHQEQKLKIGIQCFPFDILDEGAKTVVHNSRKHLGASVILPAVTYIPERHPYPTGQLPHNPARKVYHTDGGAYFQPDLELYSMTRVKPCLTQEPGVLETDWLELLVENASVHGIEVYAWVSILNGSPAKQNPDACVVDVFGRVVPGWLCPNNPEVRVYAEALVRDIVRNLPIDGIFIDRIRFPEWGGRGTGIGGALTCFCKHCVQRAAEMGIQLEAIRQYLASSLNRAGEQDWRFDLIQHCSLIDTLKHRELVKALVSVIQVRHASICALVSVLHSTAKAERIDLPVWLDLWPPSYGWLLGQNFSQLRAYADAVKIFTYHKLGGGIDIAEVLDEFQASFPFLSVEGLYSLFSDVFRFPAPSDLVEFRSTGFHPDFVTEETMRARVELGKGVPLMAGLQIWNVSEAEVAEAVQAALKARPDGIIYYNYGWAPFENMACARNVLEKSTYSAKDGQRFRG